jgi:hypothetical protein
VTTVELLLVMTHYLQIVTIYSILVYLFPSFHVSLNKFQLLIGAISFQLFYHVLVYNKKRWNSYIELFKNETAEQGKRGTNFLYIYFLGSNLLLFIVLPILFWPKGT